MEGMGEVVASVSGYHGSDRLKLIKLIDLSGASYVGNMDTNRSITHLICWKFEGNKYRLAKKLRIKTVNHQWLEDCIRKGRRISETPYTGKSGREVGAITLDAPDLAKSTRVLTENKSISNLLHKHSVDHIIDLEDDDIEQCDWDDRSLLELLQPDKSRKGSLSLSRRCKTVRSDDCGATTSTELPHKSRRRLIKKSATKQCIGSVDDTAVGFLPYQTSTQRENVASVSYHSYSGDGNEDRMRRQSEDILACNGLSADEDIPRIEENTGLNDVSVPSSTESHGEVEVLTQEVTCPDAEKNINVMETADQAEQPIELPASSMVSCVICHTEYSSTRGVLSCGHRFCFSCIQNWADHLVSKRKTSTCPLCKSTFTTITRVEDAGRMDQNVFSQTVPCPLSTQDIFILPDGPSDPRGTQISSQSNCCQCRSREPEDLLIYCQMCEVRCIHSYCLDPPLFPWLCNSCKDTRLFYRI